MELNYKNINSLSEIKDNYDNYIFDIEGTLFNGSKKIDSAFDALDQLKKAEKSIFFLSNDSTQTRLGLYNKLLKNGFEANINHVYPSTFLSCTAIKLKYPAVQKIYVVGMEGLVEEAKTAGFNIISGSEHDGKTISTEEEFLELPVEGINAVLIGFDIMFNYYKLAFASMCIQNGGHFFATDSDGFDMIGKKKGPGCGAIVSAIEKATTIEPIIFGKPSSNAPETLIEIHKLEKSNCILIGDKLENDILAGNRSGIDSCLVLSGATSREDLKKESKKAAPVVPTFVCPKVCF
jgi:phosphoglycolate phosphatase